MYEKELAALRASSRFRERVLFSSQLLDFASNDYLSLSTNQKLLRKAFKRVQRLMYHSPKASMLVNGYSPLHAEFEEYLSAINGFPAGVLFGSGFLANLALIESLIRPNDHLFMDADYHASGKFGARVLGNRVTFFRHDDPEHLRELIAKVAPRGRIIIAIEGVYSMSGRIAKAEFAHIADSLEALLIVDEAHSSGTIGEHLLGYFEYHNLLRQRNYIKLGTLSKAYASYGAYVLASREVVAFLENRAKSLIYTTALSLLDTALAYVNARYIYKHAAKLALELSERQEIAGRILKLTLKTPIVAYEIPDTKELLRVAHRLKEEGFLVGAIRKPTVEIPMLRLILRCGNPKKELKKLCKLIINERQT
ncbi:MAG: aminotransferase class I/II-fold pyridoxal phosphate-dependent enzyme [Wolinella sp.]